MGKHNTKSTEGSKRSRNRRSPEAIEQDYPKYMRRTITRLRKRQAAWDSLSLEKKQKTKRPGSMKMKRN